MWVAEDDGVFNPRTAKLGARKILIASSTDAIKPLQTGRTSSSLTSWSTISRLRSAKF
ncbi:hypothetical protein SNK04_014252 [Fusarium graminearum]